MTVAENLKRIRTEKRLTQKKLSELCGISEGMIRQYELGLRNPKYETLKKIVTAFNMSINDFLNFDVEFYDDDNSSDINDEALNHAIITKAFEESEEYFLKQVELVPDTEIRKKVLDVFDRMSKRGKWKFYQFADDMQWSDDYGIKPEHEEN